MNQAAENLPALDPGGDVDGVAGLVHWWFLLQGMVRTMPVVMPEILGQDAAEMGR